MYALEKEAGWNVLSAGSLLPVGALLTGSRTRIVRDTDLSRESTSGNAQGATANVVHLPRAQTSAFQALKDLRRLRRHTAGWDGRPSSAANRTSFDLAEKFLGFLSSASKPFAVQSELFSNGTAVLSVQRSGIDAQFQFFDDGVIAAVVDAPDFEWDDDVAGFDGTAMPAVISQYLGL